MKGLADVQDVRMQIEKENQQDGQEKKQDQKEIDAEILSQFCRSIRFFPETCPFNYYGARSSRSGEGFFPTKSNLIKVHHERS